MDEPSDKVDYMVVSDSTLYNRLKDFIECEGKSCSFDPELITPEYVYRMWGGEFSMDDIENGLREIRDYGCMAYGNPNLRNRVNVIIEFS